MRTALVAGATGLVGGHCLRVLLQREEFAEVVTIGRRDMETVAARHRHVVLDFADLESHRDQLRADDVFCCLGTTIKKAGSREAFRLVDQTYPREIARISAAEGASQFLIVTAQGANSKSPFFYNRVKGDVERDVASIGMYGTYIFRPTLIKGDRDDVRRGEAFAERVFDVAAPVLKGPLRKLKPIHAEVIARAMVATALDAPGGLKAFEAHHMRAISERFDQPAVSSDPTQ